MPSFMRLNDSSLEVGPTTLRDVGVYLLSLELRDSAEASMKYTLLVIIVSDEAIELSAKKQIVIREMQLQVNINGNFSLKFPNIPISAKKLLETLFEQVTLETFSISAIGEQEIKA
jgi:hypothetical protein